MDFNKLSLTATSKLSETKKIKCTTYFTKSTAVKYILVRKYILGYILKNNIDIRKAWNTIQKLMVKEQAKRNEIKILHTSTHTEEMKEKDSSRNGESSEHMNTEHMNTKCV